MAEKPSEKPPTEPAATAAPTAEPSTTTAKPSSGAESPRTARDPDFDDDDVHDQHNLPVPERQPTPKGGPKRVSFQEDEGPPPPPKPPRPMSPRAKAEATLIEAFPSIDVKVVKAVLVASNGKVEPAFNALLGMSDPDFIHEPAAAPPPPPRKNVAMTQEESDAMYARQLAEHYDSSYDGFGTPVRGDPPLPRKRQQDNLKPNDLYDDRERSFIDDDLPIIKQNLQKGFEDTKNTINKWFKDLQKKMDGDEDDPIPPRPQGPPQRRQDFGPTKSDQLLGIRKSAEGRRSGERDRYDADPQVLGDDFGHRLELRDDEAPPPRPPRPLANPDLFKGGEPAALGIKSAAAAADRKASPSAGGAAARPGSGKWQPLTSVEPKPADLEDHDPFSLGDSDEEATDAAKKDLKAADGAAKKDAKPAISGDTPKNAKEEGAAAQAAVEKKS